MGFLVWFRGMVEGDMAGELRGVSPESYGGGIERWKKVVDRACVTGPKKKTRVYS